MVSAQNPLPPSSTPFPSPSPFDAGYIAFWLIALGFFFRDGNAIHSFWRAAVTGQKFTESEMEDIKRSIGKKEKKKKNVVEDLAVR